jgi:cytochrome c peroxidase
MSTRLAVAIAFLLGCLVAVASAKSMSVVQRGMALSPTAATLTKGDVLSFTNDDDVIHNIHIFGPGDDSIDLGLQKPGKSLSYKFDKAGSYRVRCNIHPSVKMSVVVN